jgi:putative copper export protein
MREVLHTAFGHFWVAQMVLTAVLALPVVALVRRRRTLGLSPDAWIGALAAAAAGLALVASLNGHARTLGRAALDVPSVAIHLLAVSVWVGGLGAVVVLAVPAWRRAAPDERTAVVGGVVSRFGRLALVALTVVLVTGVVNALGELSAVSDLWRVEHGRVLSAKIVLLVVALLFAARHRWVVPKRLAEPATAGGATASFARTGAAELAALVGAVALAAALVALVPGRSLALAARGPVNVERRVGAYTVQLFVDPTVVGANEVHVTFVNAQGLAAAEVSGADVSLAPDGRPSTSLPMRLISPGHFVGDTTLPAPSRYRLSVTGRAGGTSAATTFDFRLRATSRKQ